MPPKYERLGEASAVQTFSDSTFKAKQPRAIEQASRIREMRIDWNTYQSALIITADECERLFEYDLQPQERSRKLEETGELYVHIFVKLLGKISKADTLQYILTLLNDLVEENKSRIQLIMSYKGGADGTEAAWEPFMKLIMQKDDLYLLHQTSRMLSKIIVQDHSMPVSTLQVYMNWLKKLLGDESADQRELALESLCTVLRRDDFRVVAFGCGLNDSLRSILAREVSFQEQYRTVFSYWLMSFNPEIACALMGDANNNGNQNTIAGIVSTLKNGIAKEKIVRVCLATLRNLVEKPDAHTSKINLQSMISFKLLTTLQAMVKSGSLQDDEADADAKFLTERLVECYEGMSSWDEYASEVMSLQLEWSPVHRQEKFWRENVMSFNDNQYATLKVLVQLIESSEDPKVVAIATHDVGEYVRHYPRGKAVIESLGGKLLVMSNIEHQDTSVRYESLIAVQKIMTHNWEYLGEKVREVEERAL